MTGPGEVLLRACRFFRHEPDDAPLTPIEAWKALAETSEALVRGALKRRSGDLDEGAAEEALAHVRERIALGGCRAGTPGEAVRFVQITALHKYLSLVQGRVRTVALNWAPGDSLEQTPLVERLPAPQEDDPALLEQEQAELGQRYERLCARLLAATPARRRERVSVFLAHRVGRRTAPPERGPLSRQAANRAYKDRQIGASYALLSALRLTCPFGSIPLAPRLRDALAVLVGEALPTDPQAWLDAILLAELRLEATVRQETRQRIQLWLLASGGSLAQGTAEPPLELGELSEDARATLRRVAERVAHDHGPTVGEALANRLQRLRSGAWSLSAAGTTERLHGRDGGEGEDR